MQQKIIPFFEENILTVYPKESNYFKYLSERNSDPGDVSQPKSQFIYRKLKSSYLGITAISNRTQEKNLFFTGREVLPDIGYEGEIFSCYKIANHLYKEIKKFS